MPEYTQVLIASDSDFVPEPAQVIAFLQALEELGAAPLKPDIRVAVPDEVRMVPNPFAPGKMLPMATTKAKKVKSIEALKKSLADLPHYTVHIDGNGPPQLPPIEFDGEFPDEYAYLLHLCVCQEVHSTSDPHDEQGASEEAEYFGNKCSPDNTVGIYHNPSTLKIIRVPRAGCARFWIEFEFGKMLFPKINKKLDLIEPAILKAAQDAFGLKFLQGCHWGA